MHCFEVECFAMILININKNTGLGLRIANRRKLFEHE